MENEDRQASRVMARGECGSKYPQGESVHRLTKRLVLRRLEIPGTGNYPVWIWRSPGEDFLSRFVLQRNEEEV